MRLHLSRLHFPVTTLGLGRRVGLWFQGCSLRCPGCVSVDTWDNHRGATTLDQVCLSLLPWLTEADGLTVTGGEPFEQPQALHALLQHFRATARPDADILVYSGYPWETLAPKIAAWTGLIDVLISDPYDPAAGHTRIWRGSDNQRMHLLTPLGRSRYAPWVDAPRAALPRALVVFFQQGEVWMAGIPDPGSLATIRGHLAAAGFASATSETCPASPAAPSIFA